MTEYATNFRAHAQNGRALIRNQVEYLMEQAFEGGNEQALKTMDKLATIGSTLADSPPVIDLSNAEQVVKRFAMLGLMSFIADFSEEYQRRKELTGEKGE